MRWSHYLLYVLLILRFGATHAYAQHTAAVDSLHALIQAEAYPIAIARGEELLTDLPAGSTAQRGAVAYQVASAHYFSQNEREATRYAQQALGWATAAADTITMMRATRLLADLLFAAGRYEDALALERDGIRLALKAGDEGSRVKFLSGVADNFTMLGIPDSAEQYYRKTWASLPPDDVRQRAMTASNLAKLLSEKGEHDAAITMLRPAVEQLRTRDEAKFAKGLNTLAYVYHNARMHREAIDHFAESERLNQLTDKDISTTLENLGFTAESQAALGQHEAAYTTMLKLEEQLHAYYARTANDEILALEKRFETERKEQENALLRAENDKRRSNEERLRNRWIAAAALVVLLIGLLGLLYRNYRLRGQHTRAMERINTELQDQRDRVQRMNDLLELKVLRGQLNPHFIHNCQNSAIALVKEGRDSEALVYLQGLSKLMRMVLEHSVKDRIALEAELEFLRQYLALEALRLKSLRFSVEADEQLLKEEVFLPALLVQPFVENAIWHGLVGKEGDRMVQVCFHSTEHGLCCKVTDNGVGRKVAGGRAAGERSYATDLTQERLLLLTHRMQQKGSIVINDLSDERGAACGTEVVIELTV